jgi:hypothetical protein
MTWSVPDIDTHVVPRSTTVAHWKKPEQNYVKVNTDVSFRKESGTSASGDDHGKVMGAEAGWYENVPDVLN